MASHIFTRALSKRASPVHVCLLGHQLLQLPPSHSPHTERCGGACPVVCVSVYACERDSAFVGGSLCPSVLQRAFRHICLLHVPPELQSPSHAGAWEPMRSTQTRCLRERAGLFTRVHANSGYGCTRLQKHLCAMLSVVPLCVPLGGSWQVKCPQV